MTRSRGVLASLLFVAAAGSPALANPIIGGTMATKGQFPTTVVLFVGQGDLCTGTLIAPDWVVTAAHCLDPDVVGESDQAGITASVMVFFNTVNVDVDQGTMITAKETFFDPSFNINALGSHDSGLIHLSKNAPSTITPMPVNWLHDKAPIGISVTQIGFGTRQVNAQGPAGAEFFLNNQVSQSCATLFGGDDDALLCFSQTDGKGKCEGDSGGPSLAMVDGEQKLVGITSFGDTACAQYGADTRPDAERAFLLGHVPNIECTKDAECEGSGTSCFDGICMSAPFTPGGLGSACANNTSCDSHQCAAIGSDQLCTASCTVNDNSTCPDNFDCLAAGSGGACWPSSGGGGGGCDAGGPSGGAGWSLLAGLGLAGLVLRRRRR